MDFTTITQLIGALGFPIVACFAMFWYMNKQQTQHKQEMDKIVEALNNNTLALTKLQSKIGAEKTK